MNKNNLIDPLIPYNASNNEVFIKTLVYLGNITIERARILFKKLDIINKCNKIVEELDFLKEKPFYNVYKKNNNLIILIKILILKWF